MDPALPIASALVARCGEIVYVGDDAGAIEYGPPRAAIVDGDGRLVLPAFTDAHVHFCGWAQGLERLELGSCRSLEEALARVADQVAHSPAGHPITGWGWNELDWQEPVLPNRHSLDTVAPSQPVILTRKDGHCAWVNSAALRAGGITRETGDPPGGKLERELDGEPSGLVRENAMDLLGRGIGQSEDEVPLPSLKRAIGIAHSLGLAAVQDVEGANALRAWQALRGRDELNLRVVFGIPAGDLEAALALGLRRRFGDEWLRIQAVKMFADGSLGSQTAEMFEPFIATERRGMALTSQSELLSHARRAAAGGLDVWVHAIGDAAIARVLDIFETLRAEGFNDSIFRIEHLQHLRVADTPRLAAARVIASMQPIHQPADMQMANAYLGPERARYTYAFQSVEQAGATLAFGSDCPVESLDPLRGIHAAVTRQNDAGEPSGGWFPEERLTVEQAVEGFTLGAAKASGDESRAGTLTVGKRADCVILSQDIFNIPPREILHTRVEQTIVSGQIVYSA